MEATNKGYKVETILVDLSPKQLFYLLVVSKDGETLFNQEYPYYLMSEEEIMSIGLSYTEVL